MSEQFPVNRNLNNSNIIIDNNNDNKIIEENIKKPALKIDYEPYVFTATDRNLATAFAELLSGRKVPSEITIIDPKTGKESPELHKELCKAAVKVATALMMSIPGKETYMGFVLGDFTVELRRDPLGKFFMSIEGIEGEDNENHIIEERIDIGGGMGEKDPVEEEIQINNNNERNVVFDRRVAINDTTSRFSTLIADDVIKHPELYNTPVAEDEYAKDSVDEDAKDGVDNKGKKDKKVKVERGSFTALDQLLVASEQSEKSSLNRNLLIDAMKTKLNMEPNEFTNVGIRTLSHWAAQSVLDPKMTADSIRAAINSINNGQHILENVNSLEAAADLAMIEELLNKDQNVVNSKVDISNIGQVRTDPQQGMTENQKLIHNFIADLFMPSDTSVYDNNEGKAGNRLKQIMLQHPDAVKLMLEDSFNKGTLPLSTLPAGIKEALVPVLNDLFAYFTTGYLSLLENDAARVEFGKQINSGTAVLDPELVKGVLAQASLERLESVDKAVNEASQKAAVSQQRLVTEKFTASLLNNDQANAKFKFVHPVQRNVRKIVSDIVKTPMPTEQEIANNPQEADAKKARRLKELYQANKEVMRTYKDVLLALEQVKKVHGVNLPDRRECKALIRMLDFFSQFKGNAGTIEPENFFSEEGNAFIDEILNSEELDESIFKFMNINALQSNLDLYTAEKNGKSQLADDLERYLQSGELNKLNIDLTTPTLSQMAAEPDEFNKPGMGKLIKNVLMSYFGTKPIEPQLPNGITPELTALANTLAASNSANPKIPRNLNEEQQNQVRAAISAIREANNYNAKLPELIKTREVDKRSMISSMIRYSDDKTSDAAKLGAMLKGAGPLMHKLLQGLEIPGMDPDFKTALDDMKSNLNPIDPKYVQAQMLKIVENSNNTISSLKITKPLGAASVGQAFLVTVTPTQGEPYEAVLKVIRPEVSVKTRREYEQFMIEARRIPGMEDTYKGLYEQYKKEFSLQLEADNIRLGQQFYSDGIDTDRVDTMSLVEGVPATETSMLIKQAPGDTLDRYIKKVKVRIDELKHTVAKTMDEYINNRVELQKLYIEMHDINTSLGVTAKKWLNKCLFAESGFFHGDMHPGNLMVKPRDLNDRQSKTKITIIDYGNASQLTPEQTNALLKVNVACSFGGVYQFDANEQQKPIVAKHTLKIFVDGFKALLSKEDRKLFEKREKELVDNVIKPILLKGSKTEVGVRLALIIKKLQQAGITIPGAISNMAESEKRLSNGIDELNALMAQTDMLLSNYRLDNVTTGSDPAYKLIRDAMNRGTVVTQKKVDEIKKILNYDYRSGMQLGKELYDAKHPNLENIDLKNFTDEDAKVYLAHRKTLETKYERFRKTEAKMTLILRKIDDGFKYSLEDMWENRPLKNSLDFEQDKKMSSMTYGNYLLSPKENDPLYDLHRQFLVARGKLNEATLSSISDYEDILSNDSNDEYNFDSHLGARNAIAQLEKDNPDVAEYMRIRDQMANIIKERMVTFAQKIKNKLPIGNVAKSPKLAKKQSFTTATIEVVSDKVSADNELAAMANAVKFGGDLGFSGWDLAWNVDNKKTYFEIMGKKFITQEEADNE